MRNLLINGPQAEPLTIEEVYEHTRTDEDDVNVLIPLISRARARFENRTGRHLVQQTWQVALPKFMDVIELPFFPLRDVIAIRYIDNHGQLVTMPETDYRVIKHGLKSSVTTAYNTSWPSIGFKLPDAVQIECTFGHAAVSGNQIDTDNFIDKDKYDLAKQGLLVLIAHWYRNREDTAPVLLQSVPASFDAICQELSVDFI